MATKVLLICGILSSLLYLAVNIIVPLDAPGYDPITQTISELSAIDAPSRTLWSILCAPYTPLLLAFGIGLLRSAGDNKGLRIAAFAVLTFGALGLIWPFAPMHTREALAAGNGDLRDTVHIALGIVSALSMFTAVIAASRSLGKSFFLYSVATIAILIVFGALMGKESPNIPINGPTPFLGLWQRIELGAFNVWVVVIACLLLVRESKGSTGLRCRTHFR